MGKILGMDDALSDTLSLVDIDAAVYFLREFQAPWGMDVGDTGFAQFHMVVAGEAVVRYGTQTLWLSPGDLVVFRRGAQHSIADHLNSPLLPGQAVVAGLMSGQEVFAGQGQRCTLICGHFSYSHGERHPLFSDLPDLIQVSADDALGAEPLMTLLQIIIRESRQAQPGYAAIVHRLAEAVFAAVLRSALRSQAGNVGFLAGLREPRLRRCLDHIHRASPDTPSLEELARSAGMSRSALAHSFKETLGQGPGEYASRLRLMKAARALRRAEQSIEGVGLSYGYNSAAAFSRAFKAMFGQTPSEYRGLGG